MSVPRITFEIEGVTYSLYFGMAAIEIFSTKSVAELGMLAKANPKTPLDKLKADPFKSFAFVVYAGLCNQADIDEKQRPLFRDAYDIAENILHDEQLQNDIFTCFKESRAHQALIERLKPGEKKSIPDPVK